MEHVWRAPLRGLLLAFLAGWPAGPSHDLEGPARSVGAGECMAARPEWIWCDDFEVDRLGSYFERGSPTRFVRTGGVGVDGSFGMRAHFTPGLVDGGNLKLAFGRTPSTYMAPVDAGTANHRDIHWRVFLRHEGGWAGGGGDKLSRATVFAGADWSQAAFGHVWSGGPAGAYLVLDPASGTRPDGTVATTRYNDFDKMRWLGSARSRTPIFDAGHVGAWYCVEARMRLNDPGMANGVFQMWIDGVLEAERTGLDWVGRYDGFGINAVFLENYWNAGSPRGQSRVFDNFVVSTGPIGCGG
jgi:hypothetical protein